MGTVLTLSEAGGRYRRHLEKEGRKRATLVAVESTFRVWLEPHLGDRRSPRSATEDVEDLMRTMEAGGRRREVDPQLHRHAVGALQVRHPRQA